MTVDPTGPALIAEYVAGGCVCDDPENYCGGADLDPDEVGYCKACADQDPEEHCLICPFECCAHNDGLACDTSDP